MDLKDLEATLLKEDFDVEKHASELIQSGENITAYMKILQEAEDQVTEDQSHLTSGFIY